MFIIDSIVLGLPQGAMYGLMAFGISLIYKSVGVLNWSHGSSGMFSAFLALAIFSQFNNLFLAVFGGLLFGFILGVLIEKFLMRSIKKLSFGGMLIITLGLLMIFEGLAISIWGTTPTRFPALYQGNPIIYEAGELFIFLPANDLFKAIMALVITVIMAIFLKYTKIGIAIRARSQDSVGAQVVGININKTDMITWGIGLTLASLVAISIANKQSVTPTMMANTHLYGVTAAVLGGFASPFGAIVGGLILGVIEKFVAFNISPDYQLSLILILIIIVLVVKPSGIFGKSTEGRV